MKLEPRKVGRPKKTVGYERIMADWYTKDKLSLRQIRNKLIEEYGLVVSFSTVRNTLLAFEYSEEE